MLKLKSELLQQNSNKDRIFRSDSFQKQRIRRDLQLQGKEMTYSVPLVSDSLV